MTKYARLLHALGLGGFIAIAFGPFLALVFSSVRSLGLKETAGQLIPTQRVAVLLFNSAGTSLLVTLAAMGTGLLISIALWKLRSGIKAWIRWFILLLACVPPCIHALAWMSLAGFLNRVIPTGGLPVFSLSGWSGTVWVLTMSFLPIPAAISLLCLESLETDLIDSARLQGSDVRTLILVIIPLAHPMLVTGACLIFLFSMVDYGVPSLFSLNVYALEIFAEFSAGNDPAKAFVSAVPLLAVTLLVVLLSQSCIRKTALHSSPLRGHQQSPFVWPAWFRWLQSVAILIFISQIASPLLSCITSAGSLKSLALTLQNAHQELLFSLQVSLAASLLCLPFGLSAAHELISEGSRKIVWWGLCTVSLAFPAALAGIGLIAIFNRPCMGGIYGSSLMPVFASLCRFVPVAAIILAASLGRVDRNLLDSAQVYQKNPLHGMWGVRIPLLMPGIVISFFLVFILSLGELGATLLVAPPGRATITMRLYNLLHYGASEEVAGLSMLMVIMTLCAFFFWFLSCRQSRSL